MLKPLWKDKMIFWRPTGEPLISLFHMQNGFTTINLLSEESKVYFYLTSICRSNVPSNQKKKLFDLQIFYRS